MEEREPIHEGVDECWLAPADSHKIYEVRMSEPARIIYNRVEGRHSHNSTDNTNTIYSLHLVRAWISVMNVA